MSVVRVDPPLSGDETATLLGFLDYHRDTLRMKVEGLDASQLQARLPPSTMTLGGMVKHLAFVEHWWTHCVFEGQEYAEPWASVDWDADWDWDWHSAAGASLEELLPLLDREAAVAREVGGRGGRWPRRPPGPPGSRAVSFCVVRLSPPCSGPSAPPQRPRRPPARVD